MSNPSTVSLGPDARRRARTVRVVVVGGFDRGAEATARNAPLSVGSGEHVSLRLTDPTVSRFHVEFEPTAQGAIARDLKSTNGTKMYGHLLREAVITAPVEIAVGRTVLRVEPGEEPAVDSPTEPQSFGRLLGASAALQSVYTVLSRAAPTTAPVLVLGESGTGKELVARSLHEASPRAQGPFEVVDCGGLPATLIESELFGHERGSFTGATRERAGAFERAHGGTIFLDELGELPLELQPKFLRALAEGEVRRVGANKSRKIDVRVIAATNRDLREEVNAGRFRADLYYRLAVVLVRMPPLRQRLEDLPILVPALLERIGRERAMPFVPEADAAMYERLARYAWPGNVRELRNHLEQWAVLQSAEAPGALGTPDAPDASGAPDERPAHATPFGEYAEMPLREAKNRLLEHFEAAYVRAVLDATRGNVAEAARRSGIDRRTLFRTIRRLGLRDDGET